MPIVDTPLLQDYLDRANTRAQLEAATADSETARRAYESRVRESGAPLGPPPQAPDMITRSLATLGSNLASAISGRDMYAERTSMGQMQEDQSYQQALAQRRAEEFQRNQQIKQDLTQQARDRYLTAADHARNMGDHAAAAELQDKALKATKDLEAQREKADAANRLAEHGYRTDEIAQQLKGQEKIATLKVSKTGNPQLDSMLEWAATKKQIMDEARARYATAVGPKGKPSVAGFKKFIADEGDTQTMLSMLDTMAPQMIKPAPGQTAQQFADFLGSAGIDKDQIVSIMKVHFPNEKPAAPAVVTPKANNAKLGGLVGVASHYKQHGSGPATTSQTEQVNALIKLLTGF